MSSLSKSYHNFNDLYAKNLTHRTHLVKEQLEAGLYVVKRLHIYLRKICTLRKSCSLEIIKLSEHEQTKKIDKDKMTSHVNALQQVQEAMLQHAHNELKFVADVMALVVDPLTLWYKDAELKRKKILQQEEKLETKMSELRAMVKRERIACIKQWQILQVEWREWQKALDENNKSGGKNGAKVSKCEKSFIKQRQKTAASFNKFEQLIEQANQEQRQYYNKELPMCITSMELLEVERCNEIESRLQELRKIEKEFIQPMPQLSMMIDTCVAGINTKSEMQKFVDEAVAHHGLPPSPIPFTISLPMPSDNIEHGNIDLLSEYLNQDVTSVIQAKEKGGSGDYNGIGATTVRRVPQPLALHQSMFDTPGTATSSLNAHSSVTSPASPTAALPPKSKDPRTIFVRSLYDFDSDDVDDLPFLCGTIIRVTLQGEDSHLAKITSHDEPNWWHGYRLEKAGRSREGTFPSNYTKIVPIDNDVTLRHLVEVPSALAVLTRFLELEYSQENIKFWVAVEQYRSMGLIYHDHSENGQHDQRAGTVEEKGDRRALEGVANIICREFIASNAPSQVNIHGSTQQQIMERIHTGKIDSTMFDEAQAEILKVVSSDSFARFKKSELFQRYLRSP